MSDIILGVPNCSRDGGEYELCPCPRCMRHVRVDEERCPFCAETLCPEVARREVRRLRLDCAFGALLLSVILQCRAAPGEGVRASPPLTVPPVDASHRESLAPSVGVDAGIGAETGAADAAPDAALLDAMTDWPSPKMVAIYSSCEVAIVAKVTFESDTMKVTPQGALFLTGVAEILRGHPAMVVEIRGYVHEGERQKRAWLADLRAQYVRDQLVKLGVELRRLRLARWHPHDAGAPPPSSGVSFSILEGDSCDEER